METERKVQKLREAIAEVEKKRSLLNREKLMNTFSDTTKSVSHYLHKCLLYNIRYYIIVVLVYCNNYYSYNI